MNTKLLFRLAHLLKRLRAVLGTLAGGGDRAGGALPAVVESVAASWEASSCSAGAARSVGARLVSSDSAMTIAVLESDHGRPGGVLKVAESPEAVADLRAQRDNLTALHADERLGSLRRLLPQVTEWGQGPSCDYSVESCLGPRDARSLIRAGVDTDGLVRNALAVIGELHRRTAKPAVLDEGFLRTWLEEPLATVASLYPAGNVAAAQRHRLEAIGVELRQALQGRTVRLSWVHGDYTLGNILVADDLATVVGIIDWGSASADGLPEIDSCLLWLTARAENDGRELGEVIINALSDPAACLPADCLPGSSDPAPAGTGDVSARHVVLLTWLNHIAHNINTNAAYSLRRFWRITNVDLVLSALPAQPPVPVTQR